jgi:hypothetical protein
MNAVIEEIYDGTGGLVLMGWWAYIHEMVTERFRSGGATLPASLQPGRP